MIFPQNSNSKICPAIIRVAIPRFRNNDAKNRDSVIRPRPPIWISAKITHFPKKVKEDTGTTFNPVIHVAEVDVKKRSINFIGMVRAIGSESNNVPIPITNIKETNNILPGEK